MSQKDFTFSLEMLNIQIEKDILSPLNFKFVEIIAHKKKGKKRKRVLEGTFLTKRIKKY